MISWTRRHAERLSTAYPTHAKIVRYLFSGGLAAVTNLVLLYLFTSIIHIWYLISSVLSFIIAFGVSFLLQKYWTFQDRSRDGMHKQAAVYFLVALVNLGVNTGLIYLIVEFWLGQRHYLIAQVIASAAIAIESYFVYQIFIFKKTGGEAAAPAMEAAGPAEPSHE